MASGAITELYFRRGTSEVIIKTENGKTIWTGWRGGDFKQEGTLHWPFPETRAVAQAVNFLIRQSNKND